MAQQLWHKKNHLPLSTLSGRDPYNNYASVIWKLLTPLASISLLS